MKALFHSDRRFVMFSYTASHGILLLRSAKGEARSSRCDVMFKDVRALEIRAWTDGVTIYEGERADFTRFESTPGSVWEDGLIGYIVKGDGWSGFVLAGLLQYAEDDGDFYDPSALLST